LSIDFASASTTQFIEERIDLVEERSMQQIDHVRVMEVLKATSRTFYIPISLLPDGLREAVTSAYLCMRAIDDIEDHPTLGNDVKASLLRRVSVTFQAQTYQYDFDISRSFDPVFAPCHDVLEEVSTNLGEWASYAPPDIAVSIWDATSAMADRMAYWASVNWRIDTRDDLDAYTYSVAGTVGLLLTTILTWYDGTQLDRSQAATFGRALQLTNIARNRTEDLARGVDFYPAGWNDTNLRAYAREMLARTEVYSQTMPTIPFRYFIEIPLALAKATLDALDAGQEKLSREAVERIVGELTI
jgi:farnesyl-diphosphate farnesyltransferase